MRLRSTGLVAGACLVVSGVSVILPIVTAGTSAATTPPNTARTTGGLGSTIAKVAESQVGVGDNPVSTKWSLDCDPYTTLVGVRVSSTGCGKSRRFGVRNRNELWCADFAKWVWRRAGVTKDLGMLTPAAKTFYAWGKRQGDVLTPDGSNAAVGDAVVIYPDGDLKPSGLTFADHVGIVVAVNANGTVNLVNGDFLGPRNIAVQKDDNVSMAGWTAGIWGANEQWMYISP